jgi:hypothetical protein
LNNIGSEASRQFRNKMEDHLKHKTNELATSSKNKNIRESYREMNEFKKSCQPRNNNNMLAMWKNYFS